MPGTPEDRANLVRNVQAVEVGDGSVALAWLRMADGYEVRWSTDSKNWPEANSLKVTGPEAIIAGLTNDAEHFFQVRPLRDDITEDLPWSDVLRGVTPVADPVPPPTHEFTEDGQFVWPHDLIADAALVLQGADGGGGGQGGWGGAAGTWTHNNQQHVWSGADGKPGEAGAQGGSSSVSVNGKTYSADGGEGGAGGAGGAGSQGLNDPQERGAMGLPGLEGARKAYIVRGLSKSDVLAVTVGVAGAGGAGGAGGPAGGNSIWSGSRGRKGTAGSDNGAVFIIPLP